MGVTLTHQQQAAVDNRGGEPLVLRRRRFG